MHWINENERILTYRAVEKLHKEANADNAEFVRILTYKGIKIMAQEIHYPKDPETCCKFAEKICRIFIRMTVSFNKNKKTDLIKFYLECLECNPDGNILERIKDSSFYSATFGKIENLINGIQE